MRHRPRLTTTTASAPTVIDFFRMLADDTRVAIIRSLALSDHKAGELSATLQLPSNAVSYHLKQLRALGVLRDRRSSADGRDVYYRVDLDQLARLYADAGNMLYPGLGASPLASQPHSRPQPQSQSLPSADANEARTTAAAVPDPHATPTPLRVLFLCTHNSARSQLAEALMRHMGGEQVEVYSAGSMPTEVHPDTVTVLRELGIDATSLYAKSLEPFAGEWFDYIITVCDRVRDICPAFTGDPRQAHWSFPDPVVVEDPERRLRAFRQVAAELQTRIRYLLLLPHPATGEHLPSHRS